MPHASVAASVAYGACRVAVPVDRLDMVSTLTILLSRVVDHSGQPINSSIRQRLCDATTRGADHHQRTTTVAQAPCRVDDDPNAQTVQLMESCQVHNDLVTVVQHLDEALTEVGSGVHVDTADGDQPDLSWPILTLDSQRLEGGHA